MKATSLTILALCLGTVMQATPELSSVFILGGDARYSLVDSDTEESSNWLRIGDAFAGYTLTKYRAETDTMVLTRDGQTYEVGLQAAAIKDMRIAMSGTIRLGPNQELDVRKATLIYDQESTFPVADGITFTVKATKRKDGNITYEARWEAINEDGQKETVAAPKVIARPGQSFSAHIGDLEFELKP